MDYERIHKVQMGVISPSKLRMKLLGAHNSGRKEGGSNSSRTSPSKLEDLKNAQSSLLSGDLDEEVSSNDSKGASTLQAVVNSDASQLEFSSREFLDCGQGDQTHNTIKDLPFKARTNTSHIRNQNINKGASYQMQPSGNLSTVHPVRSQEEDGNGYDSGHDNGSTSSFEFHRGERILQNSIAGPFFRHAPSKWNDAEKWIVNRQTMNPNGMKKTSQNQGSRQMGSNWGRITPESMNADQKHSVILVTDTKRVNPNNLISQNDVERFSFDPHCFQAKQVSQSGTSALPRLEEAQTHKEVSVLETPIAETTVNLTAQPVSMRDVGTEMTPIPSQGQSRTETPIGATTPNRSPISSLPSTPKRGAPASPVDATTDDETECQKKVCKTELSERELQMKIRREIAALGLQLGKMNIASWASKEEAEPPTPCLNTLDVDRLVKMEYEARAAAWEEAEKSKHTARYKREEIKIQAWENHQKAKLEAQMREVEVQVERMVARAQEKMLEKLAVTRQRVEEKQAIAEARRNRQAARTAQQVEHIRQAGHVYPSHFRCCSWFL